MERKEKEKEKKEKKKQEQIINLQRIVKKTVQRKAKLNEWRKNTVAPSTNQRKKERNKKQQQTNII